jgi:NADPH:quinone reductase-like Zn-dependent oxidoreductase
VQTTFATGWHALTKRASIREGDWVLVNAAGSGVGSSGIQIARLLGGRVIATAGADDKLDRALALGAEAVVNYRTEPLADRVRELTGGRGVDVVYESVGGEVLSASIEAMATLGQLVLVGCHAGEVVPIDFIDLFRRQLTLHGSARATEPEVRHVLDLAATGRVSPVIAATFPLDQVADAYRLMESRAQFGKIVVMP